MPARKETLRWALPTLLGCAFSIAFALIAGADILMVGVAAPLVMLCGFLFARNRHLSRELARSLRGGPPPERDALAALPSPPANEERAGLMADLREAITADQLEIHYQPKLRLTTGRVESVEALVRWNHPLLGPIPPSHFVPAAERTGHIRHLTDWVIDRVLLEREMLASHQLFPTIFVNVSADLIGDDDFADALLARLEPAGGSVGIEITETAVLANPDRALPQLNRLASAGIKIAIDDYGVGLSSLAYLKQLPATELKLDMLFIANLTTSHRDPMIVRSTIELAHGLGLEVTAEGVNNMQAYALLKVMGCDFVQGFAIAEALPPDGLVTFLLQPEHMPQREANELARLRLVLAA